MRASPRARACVLATCAAVLVATAACAQAPRKTAPTFDPALVREQQRRIAAFDSVVRLVNTDSLYRLWHAMLTTPDVPATQLLVQCEHKRLRDIYGQAAYVATQRMIDTLWKNTPAREVDRMSARLVGESPVMRRDTCGPPPPVRAPRWLRDWWVYELPKLPPSPDSATYDP